MDEHWRRLRMNSASQLFWMRLIWTCVLNNNEENIELNRVKTYSNVWKHALLLIQSIDWKRIREADSQIKLFDGWKSRLVDELGGVMWLSSDQSNPFIVFFRFSPNPENHSMYSPNEWCFILIINDQMWKNRPSIPPLILTVANFLSKLYYPVFPLFFLLYFPSFIFLSQACVFNPVFIFRCLLPYFASEGWLVQSLDMCVFLLRQQIINRQNISGI